MTLNLIDLLLILEKEENLSKLYVRRYKPELFEYVFKIFDDIDVKNDTIYEIFYRLKNDIQIRPKCIVCGNNVKFRNDRQCYNNTCSKQCKNTEIGQQTILTKAKETKLNRYSDMYYNNHAKAKETMLNRYGVDAYLKLSDKSEEIHKKAKLTFIEKYGVDNPLKSNSVREHIKLTCIEKYGVDNPLKSQIIKDLIKLNYIEKYGADNPWKNQIVREHIKLTCIEKYGVDNPMKNVIIKDLVKLTCINKYGVDNPMKNKEIQEQTKLTCINKYGVDNPMKNKSIIQKSFSSKKVNNSIGKSKLEQTILNTLIELFGVVEYQYHSEKYPYACDYYIPEFNLYIELQGLWTHGPSLFDNTNIEHILLLEQWKEKSINSNFYKNAINVWTNKDLEKYSIAKLNALNYILIYSCNPNYIIDSIKSYIDNYDKENNIAIF